MDNWVSTLGSGSCSPTYITGRGRPTLWKYAEFFFPGRDVGLVWWVTSWCVRFQWFSLWDLKGIAFRFTSFFSFTSIFGVATFKKRLYTCMHVFIQWYFCCCSRCVFFVCFNKNPPTKTRRPWGSRHPNETQRPRPTRGRVVPCTKSAPEMVNLPLPKVPPPPRNSRPYLFRWFFERLCIFIPTPGEMIEFHQLVMIRAD